MTGLWQLDQSLFGRCLGFKSVRQMFGKPFEIQRTKQTAKKAPAISAWQAQKYGQIQKINQFNYRQKE